jgi:hypothetical protein
MRVSSAKLDVFDLNNKEANNFFKVPIANVQKGKDEKKLQ